MSLRNTSGSQILFCTTSRSEIIPKLLLTPNDPKYFSADGDYIVTTYTKAVLHHNGVVVWTPPAIFKSSCEIDVEFFPFDQQKCFLKFGSWTFDGFQVDLEHINAEPGNDTVFYGMDLSEYYLNVEWDVMSVPAERHVKVYPCCPEPYPGEKKRLACLFCSV